MTTWQRRIIQALMLALIALAAVSEVNVTLHLPDSISWQIVGGSGRPWYGPLVDVLPGSAFVLSGLYELRARARVGLLMLGVGGCLLLGGQGLVAQFHNLLPLPLAIGVVWITSAVWPVVLLHLLLAFPRGVLTSRIDRLTLRFFYVALPLVALLRVAVFLGFATGLIGIELILSAVNTLTTLVYVVFLLAGTGLVVRRWLTGGRARRRSMSPVVFAMAPYALLMAVSVSLIPLDQIWHISSGYLFLELLSVAPLALVAVPAGVGIGLLRSGLDMSSVGDLVVKLSSGLVPEQLQPALARTLHDPSLQVVYWLPPQAWFADLDGSRVELPIEDSERAVSVLGDPDGPVAALIYDSSLRDEGQLAETAAAAVRMALENARLQVQLRAQLEEVRQSRARLVEAADSERQRVERNLHDGAQQQLVTLLLSMQATKAEAIRRSDRATAALIDANIAELKQALDELRELAHGIHPTILTQAGLVPAIRSLTDRCPIPVEVKGDLGDDRLAAPQEAALYFVVAEATTNAVKHSKGKRMTISLGRRPGWATIDVCDDGVGGADLARGTGLRGLNDRVAAVGGRLDVKAAPGSGTVIHVEVPCE